MKQILAFFVLSLFCPLAGQAQESVADDLTLRLQIIGKWVSAPASDTCSGGSKPKAPARLVQTRAHYRPDGTFSWHYSSLKDGQFTEILTTEGTYKVLMANFEGSKVPAVQLHYEKIIKEGKPVGSREQVSQVQLMVMMEKPSSNGKSSMFMTVTAWNPPPPDGIGPCPTGEKLCVVWRRENGD